MRVLMVCLGNICRSPMAEGILKEKIKSRGLDWEVDSAGTSAWHVGERPDSRSISTAQKHGIDISYQRARQFVAEDFEDFDLVLAMDQSNYNNLRVMAQSDDHLNKLKLILNYGFPGENRAVPDPYYNNGFDHVFEILEESIEKLLETHTI